MKLVALMVTIAAVVLGMTLSIWWLGEITIQRSAELDSDAGSANVAVIVLMVEMIATGSLLAAGVSLANRLWNEARHDSGSSHEVK